MPQVVSAPFPYPKNSWIYIFQLSALKFQNLEFATANSRVCKFSILVKVICISLHTQLPYCQSFTIHENSIARLSLAVNITQLSIFTSFTPPTNDKEVRHRQRKANTNLDMADRWSGLGKLDTILVLLCFHKLPIPPRAYHSRQAAQCTYNRAYARLYTVARHGLRNSMSMTPPYISHKITQAPDGFEQEAKKLTKGPLYEIFARDFKCILWRPDIISAYFERISN